MDEDGLCESIARAWASMDGRQDLFDRERKLSVSEAIDSPSFTGTYLGYMAEARELMRRAGLASEILDCRAE